MLDYETKSPTLQNYKVSMFKFAPALALKWYPLDFIGQAKLFHIFAANQNQGGNCICRARIFRLARKKASFTEGSFSFGRAN